MSMNEEIKAEWVARLRSGEIEQAQGKLGLPDGSRCCLGVLCDIAVDLRVIEVREERDERDGEVYEYLMYGSDARHTGWSNALLPDGVASAVGLGSNHELLPTVPWDPKYAQHVPTAGMPIALSTLNDRGVPFSEIADLIEEHL